MSKKLPPRRPQTQKPSGGRGIPVDGLRPSILFFAFFLIISGLFWAIGENNSPESLLVTAALFAIVFSLLVNCKLTIQNAKGGKWSAIKTQYFAGLPIFKTKINLSGYNELHYREEFDLVGLGIYVVGAIVVLVLFFPLVGVLLFAMLPASIAGRVFLAWVYEYFGSLGKGQKGKYSVRLAGQGQQQIKLCHRGSQERVNSILKYFQSKTNQPFVAKSLGGSW